VDFLADEIDEFPCRRAMPFSQPEVRQHILNTIVRTGTGKTLNDRVMAIMPAPVPMRRRRASSPGAGNITSVTATSSEYSKSWRSTGRL